MNKINKNYNESNLEDHIEILDIKSKHYEELEEIEELHDGWNGPSSYRIHENVVSQAKLIIKIASPRVIKFLDPYEIEPSENGTLSMHFTGSNKEVSFYIGKESMNVIIKEGSSRKGFENVLNDEPSFIRSFLCNL